MKTLLINNLSVSTLPVIILFRIFNFKILFISIEKYFRNKAILRFLSIINIKWCNYQDHKINGVDTEQFLKATPFSDTLSDSISNKFWCNTLKKIYVEKNYLSACLNRRLLKESWAAVEIMTIAKRVEINGNKIFLWAPNTLIYKQINNEFYHRKNLNIFPNLEIFYMPILLIFFFIKVAKNFLIKSFQYKKKNISNKVSEDQKYKNFKIAYFPHKGIFYHNLFLKDYYYSNNKDDPFFSKNILHIEWEESDLTNRAKDFYNNNNIKYLIWRGLTSELKIIKKIVLFSFKNILLLFNFIKFDYQILLFFLYSTFLVFKSSEILNKFTEVKLVLAGMDDPFPPEISTACKKKNIKTVALQDRIWSANSAPMMIFDYYFVSGERSKELIKKRMPNPFIKNYVNLYLTKIDKYKNFNGSPNIEESFSNHKLKCLVIDVHSNIPWYTNGRQRANSWRMNKDFYQKVLNLSDHFPQVEFLIKSKNYNWLKIPYLKTVLDEFNKRKNVKILSDTKKWTTVESVNICDFAIAIYSSLSDEILALGKPVIVIDLFGSPGKLFDFGNIYAKDYNEILKKFNSIISNYKKYNSEIDEERNKIYYKSKPGQLNKELNKIYLEQNV